MCAILGLFYSPFRNDILFVLVVLRKRVGVRFGACAILDSFAPGELKRKFKRIAIA